MIVLVILLSILLTGLMASNSTKQLNNLTENLVIQSNNEFSFRIYNMLAKDDDNDIISSFSIISALSILMNGANGKTLDNLKIFLGYQNNETNESISDQTINNGFQTINRLYENKSIDYKKYLNETQEERDREVKHQLDIANLVVRNDSKVLKQEFVDAIQLAFRAQVDRADFKHNSVEETDKINQWIRKQTNNKIEKIFDKINEQTSLIILNVVYFKGNWDKDFDRHNTQKSTFYNNGADCSKVTVDLMSATNYYRYLSFNDLNARLIQLPYKGNEISFVIVLPNDRNELLLPKFISKKEYDLTTDLNPKPIALTTGADLSRLSQLGGGDQTFTQIRHQTYISVDEEGTEALAVSSFSLEYQNAPPDDPPIEFRVDHPFLYYIMDTTNGLILFSGQINKL
ncbi:serpin B3-like isoform X2 [Oppia nitens]|uniref:serpin B3-like isoform X2 n=1 Tax=Oppia nitens TaxID=1686743 RepID=UPI0023DCC79F|nr:serpin B3-like isoform X2 [Oppia nitens]